MSLASVYLPAVLALALPLSAFAGSVTFQNHANNMITGGDNAFFHADLNNDGREDLAYINQPSGTSDGSFYVEFSNGDGLYTGPFRYQAPSYNGSTDTIAQLALGDFNHDGSMDIAVFTYASGNVYIFFNDGHGTFSLGPNYSYGPAGGTVGSVSAVAADFNHDQIFDLAFIADGRLNVWLGNANGGFTPGPSQTVYGQSLEMGDFDGDGAADLLIYNDPAAVSSAYVYYGDRTGAFPQSIKLSLPEGSAAFSAGDVNTDGKMDVIAVDPTVSTKHLFVFYGDSSRAFSSRTTISGARCLADVPARVADLDGNGQNDLVFEDYDCSNPNTGPLYLDVRTRNADSSYNPHQTVYWPSGTIDGSGDVQIDQPPIIWNADGNSKPDILIQACVAAGCSAHWDTTLYNGTGWSFLPCDPPTSVGVNVCSPASGATAASPVDFEIGSRGMAPMRDVEIWIDGSKRAEQRYGFSYYTYFHGSISLSAGQHSVTVVGAGWDQSEVKKSFNIDVQ